MAVVPEKVEWVLGADRHGRPVRLTRETINGQTSYRLSRLAISQRDDSVHLDELTVAMLRAIAEIAAGEAG